MDLKQYFRKIREVEAGLVDDYPVVVSLDTPDGGKAGRVSEVSRYNAAKMIVEGRAMLATEEQKKDFIARQLAARKNAEKEELARRLQIAILSDADLQSQIQSRKNNPTQNGK